MRTWLAALPLLLLNPPAALPACAAPPAAATASREQALRRCRAQFGEPVDAALNLFEVDRWRVLEAVFDPRGRLAGLNVVPKHWFEESHPEWAEPPAPDLKGHWSRRLTAPEYERLLARLDAVEPRGGFLNKEVFMVVTNMTRPYAAYYERAVLTRGDVLDLRRGDDAPQLVRYIRVRYGDGRKFMRAGPRRPLKVPPGFGGPKR